MKTPIEQAIEALEKALYAASQYNLMAAPVASELQSAAVLALAALKSLEGQEVVAWITKLALDVMKANEGTPFGIVEAAYKNIWGADAVPLYTTPRPAQPSRLTVDEAMKSFDEAVDASIEAGDENEDQDWIDIKDVRVDFLTRLTQAIKP